ncbi:MAG: ribonuclease III, partial [Calditrichia bacterium]|nr:ribonuclease III [Calditrichia bacterium]
AFKHRSYLNVTHEKRVFSNERLEFLGDSVLNLTVTHFLYNNYPLKDEGRLSKWKAILVSKEVFSDIASELNIGQFLLLNKGEDKTGGRERISILADVYESIVGAIYLDKGLNIARDFINITLLEDHIKYLEHDSLKNYKSILLEYTQQFGATLPVYKVIKEEGPDHDKIFHIQVEINTKLYGFGKGKNKKNAEQKAAAATLQMLEDYNDNE